MKNGLKSWFAFWHPRYRVFLVQLVVAGITSACLEFGQDKLLQMVTESLGQAPAAATAGAAASQPSAAQSQGLASAGWKLAVACLAGLVLVKALDAAGIYWKTRVAGKLKVQSEDDMESEILGHLLRKDETFFSRHSPAETVSRLSVDLSRVSDRRPLFMSTWWSVLVIVGNEGRKVALLVDELIGQGQVVIKSLESNYRKVEGIAGATILGDGRVALIVDVPGLISGALMGSGRLAA